MTEENKDKGHVDDNHEKNEKDKDKGNMIPKARLDQEINKRREAEGALKEIAESIKSDVPENFKDLVPDLPPQKLIKWIQDANAKGLFVEKKPDALDTKRPSDKKQEDLSGLSPQQMMSRGYKT